MSKNPETGISVRLATGDVVQILGPIIEQRSDGTTHISHVEFHVILDGELVTMNITNFDGATYPSEAMKRANDEFEKSLPDVLRSWESLMKVISK